MTRESAYPAVGKGSVIDCNCLVLRWSCCTRRFPASPAASAAGQIVRAAWLAGCWESRTSEVVIEEQWMAPRGRSMISMARTVHADTLIDFTQVVLREKDGGLEFETHQYNQPIALFKATQITTDYMLFENPLHDFPQRIGYDRRGADSLVAWMDGKVKGANRRVEVRYGKVRCGT